MTRGALRSLPRELEGDRRAQVAQRPVRRRFERDLERVVAQAVELRENGADTGPDPIVQRKNHDEREWVYEGERAWRSGAPIVVGSVYVHQQHAIRVHAIESVSTAGAPRAYRRRVR